MNRLNPWILIALGAIWIVAGWAGPPEGIDGIRLWSASPYRHLGWTVSVLLIVVAAFLTLFPLWQTSLIRLSRVRAASPSRLRIALPIALLVAGSVFWLLSSRFAFLGDNWLRVQQAVSGTSSDHGGGVLQLYHACTVFASRFGWEPGTTFRAISIASGLLSTAIWVRILHDRSTVAEVILGTALFLLAGWTELFCGYIEVYPPLLAGLLLWLWICLRSMNGGRGLPAVMLFLWIALAWMHQATLVWGPALGLALWISLRDQRSFPARKFLALTCFLCLTGAIAAYFLAQESTLLLRWFPTEQRPYAFLSWGHQINMLQALWLGTAAGTLLFFLGIRRHLQTGEIPAADAFLLWASVLPIVALSLFNPVLGAADWDIWMLPLPFLLLFGLRQVRSHQIPTGPILALQLVVVGPWLLLHAGTSSVPWIQETMHSDRADYYQGHPSHLHLSFLFAANGLETERRAVLADGLRAHPSDPRLPLNLAITARVDGDLVAAEELALEAYRRQRGYIPALTQLYEIYGQQQRTEDRDEIARTLLGAERADPEATYRYLSKANLRKIERDLNGR